MFCTFGEQGEQDWAVVDRKGSPSCNRIGTRIDTRIIIFMSLRRDLSKLLIERAAVDREGSPSCNRIATRIDTRIIKSMLLRRDLSKLLIDAAAVHRIVIA